MSNETKGPQPPAEAQAQDGGDAELRRMVAKLAAHVRPTCSELWAEAERLLNSTAPPSAPVGVEGLPLRYFAYDGDNGDYNEYNTLAEAVASAQELLDYAGDDGWPVGGPSICYGAVLGEAREVEGSRRPRGPDDHPDFDFIVEYELTEAALAQQPAAKPALVDSTVSADVANEVHGEAYGTDWVYHDDRAQQPAARGEMSPEFTDSARAAIAWVLYHHQGGSSPVGQPLRFALGMGAGEQLPDWRIEEAKRWAEWAGATTADFHRQQPAAVDGAMERLRTHRARRLWQADLVGGQISMDRMRAILSAALAGQQGGES